MVHLHDKDYDTRGLARLSGDLGVAGGVRLVELADGVERGVRTLEFRTGTGLIFEVLVDRAMDIGAVEHAGRSIGWRSSTGFRNPGLHEHADDDGVPWIRSFSGLLVTAGLDHIFFPEVVDASTYGYQPTISQPLHGRVSVIPAKLQGYGETWLDDGRCVLWAEGEIKQAKVFGEHLRMVRRIEADLGGNEIRITDTVRNAGFDLTPHMLLYHLNMGWPLLDEGSRFVAPIENVRFTSESVASQGISYRTFSEPQPRVLEQVYEHELVTDADGRNTVALVNDRLGLGLAISWVAEAMPCLIEWSAAREGIYALGLEPSTHHITGDQAARDDGTMIWLEAGDVRSYETTLSVLPDAAAIAAVEQRITAIHGQPTDDEVLALARSGARP